MPYAVCPGCDEDIYIPKKPRLGDTVSCPSCEAELEVVEVNPLELDWKLEDEEGGWDDEDEDEEEEEGWEDEDE